MDRWLNQIICGDNVTVMRQMPDNCIDLTVTSPPYDNLRTYNGFSFNFEEVAQELYRITKDGGVVVWVVNDATINGSETGTSFRQALYFKEIGFNLHDTMIYHKNNPVPNEVGKRYQPSFEYMFILCRGKIKTFNPIVEPCLMFGKAKPKKDGKQFRQKDGSMKPSHGLKYAKPHKFKHNIWDYNLHGSTKHPAIFPEQLANDHIISWSNPGDIVFDPFLGSGTTAKMALLNGRNYIGIDISEEYCEIARQRLEQAQAQQSLFA